MTGWVKRCCVPATILVAALSLTACDSGPTPVPSPGTAPPTRSVEGYCQTFYSEGQKFRDTYERVDAQTDPVAGLIVLLGAPQRLALLFAKLDAVAPLDIEPDVKVLQDAFQQINDNMVANARDPIRAILDALTIGASTKKSEDNVNSYTLTNCGPPPGSDETATPAVPSASPSPGPYAPSDEAFDQTAEIDYAENVRATPSVVLYDVAQSQTHIVTADGREELGQFSFAMSSSAISRDVDPVIYDLRGTNIKANGLEPARVQTTVVAYDSSASEIWHEKIADEEGELTDSREKKSGAGGSVSITSDGRWLLVTTLGGSDLLVSTSTHAVGKFPKLPDDEGNDAGIRTIGNYVLTERIADYKSYDRVIDPDSGESLAKLEQNDDGSYELVRDGVALSDGEHVIGVKQDGIYELTLPTGRMRRLVQEDRVAKVIADQQSKLIAWVSHAGGVSLYDRDGNKIVWHQKRAEELCAVGATGVVVFANGQSVLLDPRRGKQVRVSKDSCSSGDVYGSWMYSFGPEEGYVIRMLP